MCAFVAQRTSKSEPRTLRTNPFGAPGGFSPTSFYWLENGWTRGGLGAPWDRQGWSMGAQGHPRSLKSPPGSPQSDKIAVIIHNNTSHHIFFFLPCRNSKKKNINSITLNLNHEFDLKDFTIIEKSNNCYYVK